MEDYTLLYIIAGAVLLLAIIYIVISSAVRRKRRLESMVKNAFGSTPDRTYTEEELKKIATYFLYVKKDGEFAIDDITWSDLDLNDVYQRLNICFSSAGDEALYKMLRIPVFDREILKERKARIAYFQSHEAERTECMRIFAKIGRTKNVSLIEYLSQFKDLKTESVFKYLIHILLLILAVSLFFFNVTAGIVAVIAVLIFNIATYFKTKARIEPWYVSMAAMSYLENGALEISKLKIPELDVLLSDIRKNAECLRSLRSDMRFLGAAGKGFLSLSVVDILMDYVRMITHIDFMMFQRMLKKIRTHETEIVSLMDKMGELEALISIASFRETLPFYTEAEITEGPDLILSIEDGYHPLIRNAVPNSIETKHGVLLTGSNASGKSTFLRMVSLAALMAETVATVPARALKMPFFRVFTSMALKDNLLGGESYFIVEIKSIKRILDAFSDDVPILCSIDEVLRGTNTVERVAASSELLADFSKRNALIFAATHDIELTNLLEGIYDEYHFSETVTEEDVTFDYKLMPGPATTRNAIRLLSLMGYDKQVVGNAESTAAHFLEDGTWQLS